MAQQTSHPLMPRMDMGHADMDGPACKISMLWNWYTIDACFIHSSWQITTRGAFAATCIGIMLMVVLLEFLRCLAKEYDEWIVRDFRRRSALIKDQQRRLRQSSSGSTSTSTSTSTRGSCPGKIAATASVVESKGGYISTSKTTTLKFRASPLQQLIRAVIHAVMFGLGYLIMLLAMYYNGYVIISILIGALIGKFLCDWLTVQFEIHGGDEEEDVDAPGFTDEVPRQQGVEEATVCCG
ncbi:Ctr copper transporter family-domain-containing protein [Sordaria brevicollis]|uniref:Copper transport protein n=1 Tax=Sordaria brevicollis TaxID=83679 RepID=A0AAE0U8W8_SORBR|nr:Ctr copper transporter family-domain-containing protein [Sordaria brevicollis]